MSHVKYPLISIGFKKFACSIKSWTGDQMEKRVLFESIRGS